MVDDLMEQQSEVTASIKVRASVDTLKNSEIIDLDNLDEPVVIEPVTKKAKSNNLIDSESDDDDENNTAEDATRTSKVSKVN